MKRSVLALLAVSILVGCSPSKPVETGGSGADDFKIGLITPDPVSDSGWNALAYNGLKDVERELGASVDNQEAKGTKIKEAVRSYAQKGYDLVFGHGFEYNKPMVQIAPEFPDTVFISSSGGKTAPNAGAFRFYLEQGTYLGGMLAAKASKTGKLGMVTFDKIPSIESTFKGFVAGAKAANPQIQILPTMYFGSPTDVAAAKRATEQLIEQGADVIIHQANAAAQGVFDACKDRGAWAVGTNSDQNDNPSGRVIGSAVIVAGPAFVQLAREVEAGTYKGTVKLVGMKDGAIDFILNPVLRDGLPAEAVRLVEDTREKIRSGELEVPKDDF